jgi:diketogulonate reductase-like aldo/keto reductase
MEMYQVFVVLSLQWRLWSTNNTTQWLVKRCCIASILCTSNILIAQEVSDVAKEVRCSTAQVALNWIRQQNMLLTQKNKIIPVIGSRKESEIKDNLACLEFVLSNDQMQRLNEISKIELGFPHDFLNSEMIKEIIYGGMYSSMVLKK